MVRLGVVLAAAAVLAGLAMTAWSAPRAGSEAPAAGEQGATGAGAQAPASLDPRQLFTELQSVTVDPGQIYLLRHVNISRDRMKFYFNRGYIGFLRPVAGRVTGAIFVGDGELLVIPPDRVERQSLANFIGQPILEESFKSVYLRFTDETARQLQAVAARPEPDDSERPANFVEPWNRALRQVSPATSLRILQDLVGASDRPYFYAHIEGADLGVFEAVDDERRVEAVRVGAVTPSGLALYADMWCSFASRTSAARAAELESGPAQVLGYKIDTRILADRSLEGHADVDLVMGTGSDRMVTFELSRRLKVSEVREAGGPALVFFQNPTLEESEIAKRGDDLLVAVLPEPLPPGQRFRLSFSYAGNVIADVGNGVLYVGAHGSWYPNLGLDGAANYDLTFHYPERLTLVATGKRLGENTSDGWTTSHWVSDGPFRMAGFNLGEYVSRVCPASAGGTTIEVYASRGVEEALQRRHAAAAPLLILPPDRPSGFPMPTSPPPPPAPPPATALTPAALLDRVAAVATEAVRCFDEIFGTLPYSRLALSQIPGDFGQGWPELVYLPTLLFLPGATRGEMGLNARPHEQLNEIFIAHEIAHQWWGNEVGWASYHDQWLSEGSATYAAALYLARTRDGERRFRELLASYKEDLLAKTKEGQTVESGGPIWLGERLSNSLNPGGYDAIVYKKACWVLHMLRMVMDESAAGGRRGAAAVSDEPAADPRERFFTMLRDFVAAYRGKQPGTEDFAHFAERRMGRAADLDRNGSLDWFFESWVHDTGIPTYKIQSTTKRLAENEFVVQGTIEQSDVPANFEMLVPVVANFGRTKKLLGLVPVSETGGRFKFTTTAHPGHVTIDEEEILAVVK